MYLAIAVENKKHPTHKENYRIWYLELGPAGNVRGINVKSRVELLESLFDNVKTTGTTNWRCFQKENEKSTPIEIYDFMSMNDFENTHFGNLPTLSEFQETLNALESGFEMQLMAS